MDKQDFLKEVERRAYRSTLEDGFYEICFGSIFLLLAWIPILETIGIFRFYSYPLILVLVLIPWLGKRYITIPRLGAVEFAEKRKARKRYTALIGVVAIMLMLPLVMVMFMNGFPEGLTWQAVAIIAAPAIAIGVLLLNYSRMYIYALLFFFSIVASEFLHRFIGLSSSSFLAFGVPGSAVFLYGFFLLLRFLKCYPKSKAEVSNVC